MNNFWSFVNEHPMIAFWIVFFIILTIDNAIGNICSVLKGKK